MKANGRRNTIQGAIAFVLLCMNLVGVPIAIVAYGIMNDAPLWLCLALAALYLGTSGVVLSGHVLAALSAIVGLLPTRTRRSE